jgi:hypothetical protein
VPRPRKMRADGIGDIRGCEVSVVLLGHASISMAELRGDDAHRHATHGERRSVGPDSRFESRSLRHELNV